jgi:ABC-type amino acid transport substrate-binding protein
MNQIRASLGQAAIPCASSEQINQARKKVKVLVGVMHETFDPWEYNQDGGL